MWLLVLTTLTYTCFGFLLDLSTQSAGNAELKNADLLTNIQLDVDTLKHNFHKLLLKVSRDGDEIDFLKKQNQNLKQTLDNTVKKMEALIIQNESFTQNIEALHNVTLQHQRELYQIKSEISVSSSLTLQELMNCTSNVSIENSFLVGREEMQKFEKKIKDEDDKIVCKIEAAMDSFMKQVSFNNTLLISDLQKMAEDAMESTSRVTKLASTTNKLQSHIKLLSSKIETTFTDVEELKEDEAAMDAFMKNVTLNNTLITSKLQKKTDDVMESTTRVAKLESSTEKMLSNITLMSSKIETTFRDVEELKVNEAAMDLFLKHVTFNNTLITSILQNLTEDVIQLTTRVAKLESSTEKMLSNITMMSSKIETTFRDVEELKVNEAAMDLFMKHVTFNNTLITSILQKITEDVIQLTTRGSNTPNVAFKVRSPSPDSNLIKKTLKFKTRIIDYGGGYSTTTGIFTAPVFGLYLFNLQICPENGVSIHLYIKAKGDKTIGDLNSNNKSGQDGPCVSASGVEFLSQGEQAWVYCVSASSKGDVVWTGHSGNSFSGILIHT